jgi:hypothetical protein
VELQTSLFRLKAVHYLLGDQDTCNCNTRGYKNEQYCLNIVDTSRDIGTDDGGSGEDDRFYGNASRYTLPPTAFPSHRPSQSPSATPSLSPTQSPSSSPSASPSSFPSASPSPAPSRLPSPSPSSAPSSLPSSSSAAALEAESAQWNPNVVVCLPVHSSQSGSCCDTYPDSFHNLLSLACGSNLQGSNRLQRAVLYLQYLEFIWKDTNYTASVEIVPGMGHDRNKFFQSKTFQELVFGPHRRL